MTVITNYSSKWRKSSDFYARKDGLVEVVQ